MVGLLTVVISTSVICTQSAFAQSTAYWDRNDSVPGAGVPTGGTWDADDANWSLDPAGTFPTEIWTPGDFAVFSAGGDATGTFTVTLGGTQSASGITFDEGNVTISGGTQLTLTGTPLRPVLVQAMATGTISSVVGGTAGLRKTGTGPLTLVGNHTYTNLTDVDDGLLTLNGSILGSVNVQSDATLGGNATIGGSVTNDGHVAPGNSFGTMNVGSFTQNASGVLEMEVGGTMPNQYDQINVTGTASLGGVLRIVNQGITTPGVIIPIMTAGNIAPGTQFQRTTTVGGNGVVYFAAGKNGSGYPTAQSHPPGDMNLDFLVTNADIPLFALALANPDAYWATHVPDVVNGGTRQLICYGLDRYDKSPADNRFDFDDIDGFAGLFGAGAGAVAAKIQRLLSVPEPNSGALATLMIFATAALDYRRGRLPTIHSTRFST
jgi:autotransporter-associated beta strand protein